MDKGLYDKTVQYETFRKMRSAITNASQAGVMGLSSQIGAYERNKLWISDAPTHSMWFDRFMMGLHKRVGDIK